MRFSNYFIPTLKETPAEAQIASHRFMLRAGMIDQTASGIYSWLPMGLRALNKVADIVRQEQYKIGANETLMSIVQPVELWQESGREQSYGEELLRFKDRRQRTLLYSPTNEEQITDIFRKYVRSYKDLPKNFFQIQWKFRDEIRPRFGVMRGREFLMKDGYSFDLDVDKAKQTYKNVFIAYLKTFKRMGLMPIPVCADSGAIGGNMSHEFHVLASTGESLLFYDKKISELDFDSQNVFENFSELYAASEDKHDSSTCLASESDLAQSRGIEVGHIFFFGTKYTKSMNASVTGAKGEQIYPEMGSYGIGVSRLLGAIIEANHDDKGIIWPKEVAPYQVGLINLSIDNDKCAALSDDIYQNLIKRGFEVLYDDRHERAGIKLADMDLIGLPYQIIVGKNSLTEEAVEIKNRRTGEISKIDRQSVDNYFKDALAG
ncbi:MAG: proline--tRNA ligase [Holosporales bacterium]|jgi:prolyl-tRNA synthetase|nr:proline--tRNA ligase [Holosporales bacterium]